MVYSCKVLEKPGESKLITWFGYFDDTKQVGECGMKLVSKGQNKGSYYLIHVKIDETHRGKGLCNSFLRCVLKRYPDKKVYLSVLMDNTPAIKCYQKLGFVEIDRGNSTLWMEKQ
jgi:ribosomal protein S18 acetylase RimI-like enzyme